MPKVTLGAPGPFAPWRALGLDTTAIRLADEGEHLTPGCKATLCFIAGVGLLSMHLLADRVGSVVVDIRRWTTAPDKAQSIFTTWKPKLSSQQRLSYQQLAGASTEIIAGETLGFYVESADNLGWVDVILFYRKLGYSRPTANGA